MPIDRIFRLALVTLLLPSACLAQAPPRLFQPMETSLIPLNSPGGRSLLQESSSQESFWSFRSSIHPNRTWHPVPSRVASWS